MKLAPLPAHKNAIPDALSAPMAERFLDELATAPMLVQEKLLRVIEYGELERVGGSQPPGQRSPGVRH